MIVLINEVPLHVLMFNDLAPFFSSLSLFQPWCRFITTIYNYFVVTNFFWMFVEGCYLHTAIVMTYSTDKLRKWVFLFIGWCEYVPSECALVMLHSALVSVQ